RQRQQRLMEIEHLQRQIADLFLRANDIEKVMNQILALVGQALDVSRIYVAHFRKNERLMDTLLEWCAANVPSEKERNQGIAFADIFPSLYPLLIKDNLIAPRSISELPEDMRTYLELRGHRGLMMMPINAADRFEGLI